MNPYQRIIKQMPTNEERKLIDLSKVERLQKQLEEDIIKSRQVYQRKGGTNVSASAKQSAKSRLPVRETNG